MKTLYDLLGALAEDDAESIRTAFRKAVKANHPDFNPADPDAPLRFRQIVRANAILSDPVQRAAYDRMLASALRQIDAKPKAATRSGKIYKRAADAMAAIFLSVVSIGGYMLFEHMSAASAVPATSAVPAAVAEDTARRPAEIAAVAPAAASDTAGTTGRDEQLDGLEGAGAPNPAAIAPIAVLPAADLDSTQAVASAGPASDLAVNDAKSYREWGTLAYRAGDLPRAIVNFDLAIRLDPSFADAYIDRGIVFYRIHKLDRAFADIARAKRLANANRAKLALPAPHKTSLAPATTNTLASGTSTNTSSQ
jgi:curved DNA-binding protein CbpA